MENNNFFRSEIERNAVCSAGNQRYKASSRREGQNLGLDLSALAIVTLLEDELLTVGHALPNVMDILNDSLEMRGGVVRASDEDVVFLSALGGLL